MSKYYSHIECTPTEMDWIPDYMEVVPGLVAKHGGRYVYRTTDVDPVEMPSDAPSTFSVCIERPSADAANAFYADPDHQSHKRRRLDGSATRWCNAPAFTE
jgi:uncharacterized protein (DUF1330 family)